MSETGSSATDVPQGPNWRKALLAVIALLLLSGGLAVHQYFRVSNAWADIDRSHRALGAIDDLVGSLLDAEHGARDYLITGRKQALASYLNAQPRITAATAALADGTARPRHGAGADELGALSRERVDQLQASVDSGPTADAPGRVASDAADGQSDRIRLVAADLKMAEQIWLDQRQNDARRARRSSLVFGTVCVLLTGTLGALALALERNVDRRRAAMEQERTGRERAEAERDRLHDRERQARADAENAIRMKDEFLATVSHELRTPLNSIVGWVGVMKQDQSRETLRKAIDVIERNSRRQAQMIDELLDASRIVSGTLRLDVRAVNFASVIDDAVAAARAAADARGVHLTTSYDDTPDVQGDRARLQQVVWNLLCNAIKFTNRGGIINVALRVADAHAEIEVADDGHGIAPAVLPYVFDRFLQGDSSSTRRHGGLGLGLAIVKNLVELQGGSVMASSDGPSRGATFTVRLPLGHPVGMPAPERREAPPVSKAVLADVVVMVVDDEADARDLVQRLLEDAGARVSACETARAALQTMQDGFVPDVIVSDVAMPDQDGYDFMKRVRQMQAPMSSVPAAALTALARVADRRRALLAGFQTHLTKPVDPGELVATVATLAGRTGKSYV